MTERKSLESERAELVPDHGGADAGVGKALEALSLWCTSERLKLRDGRGGFDDMSDREIGILIVEAEIDKRSAALSKPAPVATNASAELSKFANDLAAKQEPLGVQISAEALEGAYIRDEPTANASAEPALNWKLSDDAKARIAEINDNLRSAALNASNIVAGSSNASAEARLRPSDCANPMQCGWHHVPTEPEIGLWMCSQPDCCHMAKALSTHPHASDCDKQGETTTFIPVQDAEPANVAGRTGGAHPPTGASPSDRTADVTVSDLATFLRKRSTDYAAWPVHTARALLDAFTVGRR